MNSNLLLNCLYCATLLLACSLTICTPQIQLQPANIDLKVSQTVNAGTCISRESLCSQLQNDVEEIVNNSIIPQFYGLERSFPADSCADVYQGYPSGYYWLNVDNEPQLVYCSLISWVTVCDGNSINISVFKTTLALLNVTQESLWCSKSICNDSSTHPGIGNSIRGVVD